MKHKPNPQQSATYIRPEPGTADQECAKQENAETRMRIGWERGGFVGLPPLNIDLVDTDPERHFDGY
jgi:hypothetical protein